MEHLHGASKLVSQFLNTQSVQEMMKDSLLIKIHLQRKFRNSAIKGAERSIFRQAAFFEFSTNHGINPIHVNRSSSCINHLSHAKIELMCRKVNSFEANHLMSGLVVLEIQGPKLGTAKDRPACG
jgi:hypothetical protein